MAWETDLVVMVRSLIGDMTEPYAFEDDRLQQSIVVAGLLVSQEFDLDTEYEFDLSAPDISPDPTDEPDLMAMALFSLKAACLLSLNSYQSALGGGIRVRDGDSEVDTTAGFKGYSDILTLGPCASYRKLLTDMVTKQGMNNGGAVMSPYSDGGDAWGNRNSYGNWNPAEFWNIWRY